MAFALFPAFSQIFFATVVIGGGGTAFVKSLKGGNGEVARTVVQNSSLTTDYPETPESALSEKTLREVPVVPVKAENCKITKAPVNIPWSFRAETKDYVTVSCEDKTLNPFPYNWTGLFPKSVFKSGEKLDEGQELIIKIEDVSEELTSTSDSETDTNKGFKINLSSEQFETNVLTAEWNYLDGNDSWAVVTVTHPSISQKIYLLLNEDEHSEWSNCEIISNLKHVPESFKDSLGNYFSISCGVSGVDTFPDPIQLLLPKDVFKNQEQFTVGKWFDLKIETDMGENEEGNFNQQDKEPEFGITFSGEAFANSKIDGKWSYETEGLGAFVKLSQDDKQAYLLLSEVND